MASLYFFPPRSWTVALQTFLQLDYYLGKSKIALVTHILITPLFLVSEGIQKHASTSAKHTDSCSRMTIVSNDVPLPSAVHSWAVKLIICCALRGSKQRSLAAYFAILSVFGSPFSLSEGTFYEYFSTAGRRDRVTAWACLRGDPIFVLWLPGIRCIPASGYQIWSHTQNSSASSGTPSHMASETNETEQLLTPDSLYLYLQGRTPT